MVAPMVTVQRRSTGPDLTRGLSVPDRSIEGNESRHDAAIPGAATLGPRWEPLGSLDTADVSYARQCDLARGWDRGAERAALGGDAQSRHSRGEYDLAGNTPGEVPGNKAGRIANVAPSDRTQPMKCPMTVPEAGEPGWY
jgi:hypothetical protein